jgi:hypothetical protein
VTASFKVTSVRIVGPLYGLQSRNGYDMPPDTKLTPTELKRYFTPWKYVPKPMIWDGRYVSIQPVPATTTSASAAPAPSTVADNESAGSVTTQSEANEQANGASVPAPTGPEAQPIPSAAAVEAPRARTGSADVGAILGVVAIASLAIVAVFIARRPAASQGRGGSRSRVPG